MGYIISVERGTIGTVFGVTYYWFGSLQSPPVA